MEVPSMQDFKEFESRMMNVLYEMKGLIANQSTVSVSKKMILTVKDVTEEYNFSPHIQRLARSKGYLKWISGSKEVKYNRSEVEEWIESQTIK